MGECIRDRPEDGAGEIERDGDGALVAELAVPLVTANAVNAAAAAATNGRVDTVDTISGVLDLLELNLGRLWCTALGETCGDFDTSPALQTFIRFNIF